MKRAWFISTVAVFALALEAGAGTIVQKLDDIQFWVGSGPNRAALIIDWQDEKNAPGESVGQALVWGFRWQTGQQVTGRQMIEAIAAADPRLHLEEDFRYGDLGPIVFGLGYDLDGDGGTFSFDHLRERGAASDADDHFAEGFLINGYWNYKVANSSQSLPVFGSSGSGFANRQLSNGSWDAWLFSSFDRSPDDPPLELAPGLAVVPEPASVLTLMTGAILLLKRRRREVR